MAVENPHDKRIIMLALVKLSQFSLYFYSLIALHHEHAMQLPVEFSVPSVDAEQ